MADWQAGLILLTVVPMLWSLMYRGWRARARRQRDLAALPSPPATFAADRLSGAEGVYVSTVTAGDWLDRVVARGLGARSAATLDVGAAGLLWQRSGAVDLFVPAADVEAVRRERGQAGKFTAERGVLVVTWRLAGRRLDTAFRPRDLAATASIEEAISGLRRDSTPPPDPHHADTSHDDTRRDDTRRDDTRRDDTRRDDTRRDDTRRDDTSHGGTREDAA